MLYQHFKKNRFRKGIEIEDSILTATEGEAARLEKPIARSSSRILLALIIIIFCLILTRLFYLTIIKGAYYREVAQENRIRQIPLKAPRGQIFDKNGNRLVENIPSIDVVAVPSDVPFEPERRKAMTRILAETLSMNEGGVGAFLESLERDTQKPVLLATHISQEQALIIKEKSIELPGIRLENTAIRNYAEGTIFAHLVGYDGKITKEELKTYPHYLMTDNVGKMGLEKYYEHYLHGMHGTELVEVDSRGNIQKELGATSPVAGANLFLNIDGDLQKKIFDSLSHTLERIQTKTAAAVAIDPRNGGVLALVSLPSFNNNLFSQGISAEDYNSLIGDQSEPLFNRAISGEYPPGSVIKPLIATAALEEGVITENTTVNCQGGIQIGGFSFGDWKVHGPTDVRKAIAESCDVFFYSVGGGWENIGGLGMSKMKKYENLFGLGIYLGIDLTGEASGLIPDEQWKQDTLGERWYVGNSYHAAIGQGFIRATPLQITNAIAAVANGGTLFKPRVVNKIQMPEKEIENKPEVIRENFISRETLRIVQEGMRQTVESGTAQTLKSLPANIAGKTGTAQFGTGDETHAWFVSYAPYEDPVIAMAVLVEGGGEGHQSALPVTKEVYEWYFNKN